MVEGSQGSLVGLAPVDKELFKDSHNLTSAVLTRATTSIGHLLGRQFMVVVMVFTITSPVAPLRMPRSGIP
jgi:hypothetical protein